MKVDDPRNEIVAEVINLEKYPLLNPESDAYLAAVKSTRAGLQSDGCASLKKFIREEYQAQLREESLTLGPKVNRKESYFTPYVAADDSFPESHPRNRLQHATNIFVTQDLIPEDLLIQKLYRSPALVDFLADCFDKEALHQFDDPMRGLVTNVMKENTNLPWHFDANEFIVSLMTVRPEEGGPFEYCPNIRTPGNENYEQVQAVLDGDHTPVKSLQLDVGDVQLFMGRYSLHRVNGGSKGDRHTAIFGYSEYPGYVGTVASTMQAFGYCKQEHIDADKYRHADGLA